LTLKEDDTPGVGTRLLTGVRGGYMGMLMFTVLGTMLAVPMLHPIALGAGLLMGRKAVGDERKRLVTRRQGDAKAALRRYIDDVTFHVGKESRDMLRRLQRDLRDHFTTQAEEMKRSLQESLQAAERSVKTSKSEREARLTVLKAELQRLDAVQK